MSTVTSDTEPHAATGVHKISKAAGAKTVKTVKVAATVKAARRTALDCAGFELMLAEVLDRDQLPLSARIHLEACSDCAHVLAAFEDLAAQVRQLPLLEPEPTADLWPQIAAKLRAEGVIHADEQECRATGASPVAPTAPPAPRLVPRPPNHQQ